MTHRLFHWAAAPLVAGLLAIFPTHPASALPQCDSIEDQIDRSLCERCEEGVDCFKKGYVKCQEGSVRKRCKLRATQSPPKPEAQSQQKEPCRLRAELSSDRKRFVIHGCNTHDLYQTVSATALEQLEPVEGSGPGDTIESEIKLSPSSACVAILAVPSGEKSRDKARALQTKMAGFSCSELTGKFPGQVLHAVALDAQGKVASLHIKLVTEVEPAPKKVERPRPIADRVVDRKSQSELQARDVDRAPSTWQRVGWIAVGVGSAGLVAGGVAGILALRDRSEIDDHAECTGGTCQTDDPEVAKTVNRYNTLVDASYALMISGAVATVVGVPVLIASWPKESERTLTVGIGPSGASLRGTF